MYVLASGDLTVDRFDAAITSRTRSAVLDLQAATFVDMYGMVGLTCAALSAKAAGRSTGVILPRSPQVERYMSRMGFDAVMREIGVPCHFRSVAHRDRSDSLVELQLFDSTSAVESLSELLYRRLVNKTRPQQMVTPLAEALFELGANVVEHSGSTGVVAAQVYRAGRPNERVDVVIGDAGVGLLGSFLRTKRFVPKDDRDAIDLALQYLVSSVDDPGRGQGLTTSVEETTGFNGVAHVRSGGARRRVTRTGYRDYAVPHLPGTIVCLSIPCLRD